jgi:hypothetical protein
MSALDWIHLLLLGGLLGALGQGVRAVAGLKKVNDRAARDGKPFAQLFEASTLLLSLLIGFIAGALAILGMTSGLEGTTIGRDLAITLIGAGYAGTDFIEAFIKKYLPAARGLAEGPAGEPPAVG